MANGRLDGVGRDCNDYGIQSGNFVARQALDVALIGDSAEQHAPPGIGERRDFIGQIIASGIRQASSDDPDLLEFPLAVFSKMELLPNFLFRVVHALPPQTLNRSRLVRISALSRAPSACCS